MKPPRPRSARNPILLTAAALAATLLAAACASSPAPTPTPTPAPDVITPAAMSPEELLDANIDALLAGANLPSEELSALDSSPRDLTASDSSPIGASPQGGIQVSGYGSASADPDIAIVSLGVEAVRPTVTLARNDAAQALARIVNELQAAGVPVDDIRTTRFSIYPRYDYIDNRQQLQGFQITNTLSVTLRDLDNAASIIDRAIAAGGDLSRVNNISFSIDNPEELQRQARIAAIKDAIAKADLYATQLGVTRGTLISISESPADPYAQESAQFDMRAAAQPSNSAPTQIFAGQLNITARVQIAFSIN